MIDAPGYDFDNDESEEALKGKTKKTEKSLRDYINSIPR